MSKVNIFADAISWFLKFSLLFIMSRSLSNALIDNTKRPNALELLNDLYMSGFWLYFCIMILINIINERHGNKISSATLVLSMLVLLLVMR